MDENEIIVVLAHSLHVIPIYLCVSFIPLHINSFPGHDYRNPAPNLFKPLRQPVIRDPNAPPDDDDEVIEVEVALAGENLPQATSTTAAIVGNGEGDDLGAYEVEVVVDFGVSVVEYPALTASNISRAQQGASNVSSASSPQQMQFAQALGPGVSANAAPAPMNLFADSNSTQEGATTASERPQGKSSKRRSTLGLNLRGGDADESDRMSDVSETWAEDRYAPATEEEKQVCVYVFVCYGYCCSFWPCMQVSDAIKYASDF